MAVRQNQSPQDKATKSIYLPKALIDRANRMAAREGHFNFSTIVAKALTEYFNRRKGADTEEAA